jgi:hypothetical protein
MIVTSLLGIGVTDSKEGDCADAHCVSRAKSKTDSRVGIMRTCDTERKASYKCTQLKQC